MKYLGIPILMRDENEKAILKTKMGHHFLKIPRKFDLLTPEKCLDIGIYIP